jgi:hypothetical protein
METQSAITSGLCKVSSFASKQNRLDVEKNLKTCTIPGNGLFYLLDLPNIASSTLFEKAAMSIGNGQVSSALFSPRPMRSHILSFKASFKPVILSGSGAIQV